MTTNLLAFVASFVFVFLKATQQLNVVGGHYKWVLPTSLAMAACEVFTIAAIAHVGWGWIVLWVGAGSGLGAIAAMFIHSRYIGKDRPREETRP